MDRRVYVGIFSAVVASSFIAGISAGIGIDISPLGISGLIGNTFLNATESLPQPQGQGLPGVSSFDLRNFFNSVMTIAQIGEFIVLIGGILGSLLMGGWFFGLGSWLCGLAGGYLLPYGYLTQNQALGGFGLVLLVIGALLVGITPDRSYGNW